MVVSPVRLSRTCGNKKGRASALKRKRCWHCRAFQNGRAIAKAGAPEAMLAAMQDHMAASAHTPQVPTAVCSALRRIAVNDDICKEFADAGGVTVTMQVSLA